MGKKSDTTYFLKTDQVTTKIRQNQLAHIIGIAPDTVSKIMLGKKPCKKPIAILITAILDQQYQEQNIDKYFTLNDKK